jgi:DNA-binding transcriptional ArsR family regulator
VAIEKLDALDLEAPDAVRTGDNNPCLTSSQAAEYFRKHAKHRVAEVFTAIYKVYLGGGVGLTVDQLEVQLGRTHQSVSPRLTELRDKGLVKDSGQTLLTRSKQRATVWTPTDVAIEAAKHDGLPWSWQ